MSIIKKILLICLFFLILFLAYKKLADNSEKIPSKSNLSNQSEIKSEDKKVIFSCLDEKTIDVVFHLPKDESVDIKLSDGRKLNLKHAVSANGARYANEDESVVFWNTGHTAFLEENGINTYDGCSLLSPTESASSPVGIANPASVNCEKVGGVLSIEKKEDGGEYGLCYFDDGRACEEWALMRGQCPLGGVKTTGLDTLPQKYCAWQGGKTTTTQDAVCTFKNGKICSLDDLYNNSCQQ